MKLVCKHCKQEFRSKIHEAFCKECKQKITDGTLRICDRCGGTWECEEGECGIAVENLNGTVDEYCDDCFYDISLELYAGEA